MLPMNNPKFQIFRGGNEEIYFRLTAANGEPILASEGYTTEAACLNGIESVKSNAPFLERYEQKEAANGQFYFLLKATNGQVIGNSEMYTTKAAMQNGIESVMRNAPIAPIENLT